VRSETALAGTLTAASYGCGDGRREATYSAAMAHDASRVRTLSARLVRITGSRAPSTVVAGRL